MDISDPSHYSINVNLFFFLILLGYCSIKDVYFDTSSFAQASECTAVRQLYMYKRVKNRANATFYKRMKAVRRNMQQVRMASDLIQAVSSRHFSCSTHFGQIIV